MPAVAAPKNVRPGAGCRRRTENVRPGTVVWPDAVAAPKNVRPGTVANPIHKLNNNNMLAFAYGPAVSLEPNCYAVLIDGTRTS